MMATFIRRSVQTRKNISKTDILLNMFEAILTLGEMTIRKHFSELAERMLKGVKVKVDYSKMDGKKLLHLLEQRRRCRSSSPNWRHQGRRDSECASVNCL